MKNLLILAVGWFVLSSGVRADQSVPDGWTAESPRREIRPDFTWDPSGGPDQGSLIIRADHRAGLMGSWTRTIPVQGNHHYRFSVDRKTEGVALPRRTGVARMVWLDASGGKPKHAEPSDLSYRPGERPRAEPELPKLVSTRDGWDRIEGVYLSPPNATQVRLELHFRWGEPHSSVRWTVPKMEVTQAPAPRTVRLATVHFQPRDGKTAKQKREQFATLIADAAGQRADLIVLPETLTFYGSGGSYADAAEPIPGPSSDYFAKLAMQHDTYIVAGLIERDGHLIYNVAVLLGPDGNIVGKYRKVTLPRGEIEGGVTPGDQYPVFETRFGKVGMMVCYDGFFPEVARELSNRGAEVIAWPVWGCNPLLASARACENHVYLISSTYMDFSDNWAQSAIYAKDGTTLAHAENWGSVCVAEVDLGKPLHWPSLGDFQAEIQAHRPVVDPIP
ncbi:(R)-stereoselective amidase [Rubripirellula lacrimiformis]|uniref:(R)-stereoselective amidase n=1 Tax=Rubripirellula lacrimiformis TaxID=1930273 RepID=A0A517N4K8_9BACT|nr:carbon-nitrogen hydrolase family protein [Rubripirellula lacrimiformis]QDT02077.1 (R)-stereoselective amidase [Rubripirellula lacrimiformis]